MADQLLGTIDEVFAKLLDDGLRLAEILKQSHEDDVELVLVIHLEIELTEGVGQYACADLLAEAA